MPLVVRLTTTIVNGLVYGSGAGASQSVAKEAAATQALEQMHQQYPGYRAHFWESARWSVSLRLLFSTMVLIECNIFRCTRQRPGTYHNLVVYMHSNAIWYIIVLLIENLSLWINEGGQAGSSELSIAYWYIGYGVTANIAASQSDRGSSGFDSPYPNFCACALCKCLRSDIITFELTPTG